MLTIKKVYCCFCQEPHYYEYFANFEDEEINIFKHRIPCQNCINKSTFTTTRSSASASFFADMKQKLPRFKWLSKRFSCISSFKSSKQVETSFRPHFCRSCIYSRYNVPYCDENYSAPILFIPNIDRDLLPRFTQMLSVGEQYSFAFSSKENFNYLQLIPLIVAREMQFFVQRYYLPSFLNNIQILLTEKIEITCVRPERTKYLFQQLSNLITARTLVINAVHVEIFNTKISANDLLLLLSDKTEVLICSFVNFLSATKLSAVIRKVPKIEKLIFKKTNINFDNLWKENMLRYCKNLIEFEFTLKYSNMFIPDYFPVLIKVGFVCEIFINPEDINVELSKELSAYSIKLAYSEADDLTIYAKIRDNDAAS